MLIQKLPKLSIGGFSSKIEDEIREKLAADGFTEEEIEDMIKEGPPPRK